MIYKTDPEGNLILSNSFDTSSDGLDVTLFEGVYGLNVLFISRKYGSHVLHQQYSWSYVGTEDASCSRRA